MRISRWSQVQQRAFPWIILSLWAVGSVWAFWFYEMRLERPFARAILSSFNPDARTYSAEAWFRIRFAASPVGEQRAAATVIHVYRENCACNRFTSPHLAQIVARYHPRGVKFATVPAASAPAWIDATPAALVFDARGKLLYFGPYSDAARCGSTSGFVERVLDWTLTGRDVQPQPILASGCFCTRHATDA